MGKIDIDLSNCGGLGPSDLWRSYCMYVMERYDLLTIDVFLNLTYNCGHYDGTCCASGAVCIDVEPNSDHIDNG